VNWIASQAADEEVGCRDKKKEDDNKKFIAVSQSNSSTFLPQAIKQAPGPQQKMRQTEYFQQPWAQVRGQRCTGCVR
jgi:hypothetical protein